MPFCENCKGIGKIIDKKYKTTVICSDCDGKGIVSELTLKFNEYYKHQKQVQKEIEKLQTEEIVEHCNNG
jgi:hypothetical protein